MKTESFVAFYDPHIPHHSPEVIDWWESQIRDVQPDHLICGGDLFEADAASRWDNENDHDLLDEYQQAQAILQRLREAAPERCKAVWVRGNHDENILTEGRIPKPLRRIADWRQHPKEFPEFARWQQIRYRNDANAAYRIGQATFVHGYAASVAGLKRQMYHFAHPWGVVISGHTHRPTELIQAEHVSARLPYWRLSAGCGQDYCDDSKVQYMRRGDRSNWGHSIVVGEAAPLKSPRHGRYWHAENRILRVGTDEDARLWESKIA